MSIVPDVAKYWLDTVLDNRANVPAEVEPTTAMDAMTARPLSAGLTLW